MRRSVNIFGALGYMSVLVQWLWLGVTLLFPLVAMSDFRAMFLPTDTQQAQQAATPGISLEIPSFVEGLFVILAIIFTLGVCIYAIIAVPKTVGRAGKTLTQRSAAVAIPRITHHQKISVARRKKLTEYITWSIKLIIVTLPLLALLIPTPLSVQLEHAIVIVCGLVFGSWSLLMFGVQYLAAHAQKVDPEHVW